VVRNVVLPPEARFVEPAVIAESVKLDAETAKSAAPATVVVPTTASADTVPAPTAETDAGAMATSATPAAFVKAVLGLSVAIDPLSEKVTNLLATGADAASNTVARALKPPPAEIPLVANPAASKIPTVIDGAVDTVVVVVLVGGVLVSVVPVPVPVAPGLPPPPPHATRSAVISIPSAFFK